MSMVKKLAILGSTGSIGTQALEIAKRHDIKITGLCSISNIELLEKQVRQFNVPIAAVFDEEKAQILSCLLCNSIKKIYLCDR